MIEIKNRSKLHLDFLSMVIQTSKPIKSHLKALSQVVVNDKTILLKNNRGLYIASFSLAEEVSRFEKEFEV